MAIDGAPRVEKNGVKKMNDEGMMDKTGLIRAAGCRQSSDGFYIAHPAKIARKLWPPKSIRFYRSWVSRTILGSNLAGRTLYSMQGFKVLDDRRA
jgi:hypothetical protein